MSGEKTTNTTEIVPPLQTTVISGTGSGSPIRSGTIAQTPDGQPNIALNVISPIMAILIRFGNTFLTTLVGLVMAAMTPAGSVLKAGDFYHLVLTCATLSVAGAGVGFLKDCVTILGKLETKFPLLTGSV